MKPGPLLSRAERSLRGDSMRLFPDTVPDGREALVSDTGERVLYGTLKSDCAAFSRSVPERCLVLMLCDNSTEAVRFYVAALYADCVPLLLDENLYPDYLREYCRLYRPRLIWAPTSREALVSPLGRICFRAQGHILVRTEQEDVRLHPELALLLTTSGSTGNPKVVRLSRRNITENTKAIIDAIRLDESARGVTTLPMNYSYGMAICNMHLFVGATLLVTKRKAMDPLFGDWIRRERITDIQGVPFLYEMLDKLGFFASLPDSLRLATMGGGKARESLQEKMNAVFAERGVRFYALYGQTEGTTMLTKLPDDQEMNDPNCIGVACLGMQARTDPETGELIFTGSSVCMGYAEKADDLSRGDENHGLLRTGDLAEIDRSGRIYLVGRLSRFLKMSGVRVNLDDIENLALRTLSEGECACCGRDNDLHLFVSGPCDPSEIKRVIFRAARISATMLSVHRIGRLPRQANGKVDYQQLNRLIPDRAQGAGRE